MKLSFLGLCLATLLCGARAFAGESLFSRAYTTETVPEGHYAVSYTHLSNS